MKSLLCVKSDNINVTNSNSEIPFRLNLYQKLSNPMKHYFKLFTNSCSGIIVKEVLAFLKVMLKLIIIC